MISEVKNMDCIEGMKQFPDKFFDLAVVDPPYGIGVNHNMGRRKGDKNSNYKPADWDKEPPPVEYFKELFRVSQRQCVFGANNFISRMPYDTACWLLWDKGFSEDVSFAQYEMAWTSFPGTCKKISIHPSQIEYRFHPTQKPIKLYDWILKKYSAIGQKILDTHMGSQSSRIAAHRHGLDYWGYEIDKDYFEQGNKRYSEAIKQQRMF